MAILTKPSVLKGVSSQFSLNKSELASLSIVSNDSYFSDMSKWKRVSMIFKSSFGNQHKVVEFNATQESPIGHFLISEKARDVFEILKIKIIDFDGGFLNIPRSELNVADFHISFSEGENEGENEGEGEGGEVTSGLLSTDNEGDFISLGTLLEGEKTMSLGFEAEGPLYTYRYLSNFAFNTENPTVQELIDNDVYKLRVYFSSFSTEVEAGLTVSVSTGYGWSHVDQNEALSSIQQFGYVDIPFQWYPEGFILGVFENTPYDPNYNGSTTFEISKMEVIE